MKILSPEDEVIGHDTSDEEIPKHKHLTDLKTKTRKSVKQVSQASDQQSPAPSIDDSKWVYIVARDDVYITCSTCYSMLNLEYHDEASSPCFLGVKTADGSPPRIIARGEDLNPYFRGVYVCEDIQVGTLVSSLQELQNVELGITSPPLTALQPFGSSIGGFVHDDCERAFLIANMNCLFNDYTTLAIINDGLQRWTRFSYFDSKKKKKIPISPCQFMSARIRCPR